MKAFFVIVLGNAVNESLHCYRARERSQRKLTLLSCKRMQTMKAYIAIVQENAVNESLHCYRARERSQ